MELIGEKNKEICTLEKRGNIYILTLTGLGEHRLNPDLIYSIRSALAQCVLSQPPLPQFLSPQPMASSFQMVLILHGHNPVNNVSN
ncbi:conserved hypothetical protein [Ricinus communis]|uniref:Uncharacterized protein n=1 Tax=Ricinus communis TaxID=3988 RepID=B9SR25_RICCO|nr:conserved hypothetical protein [Ricinus communis]